VGVEPLFGSILAANSLEIGFVTPNATRVGKEALVAYDLEFEGINVDIWDAVEIDGHARTWRAIFYSDDGTEGNVVGAVKKSAVLVASVVFTGDGRRRGVDDIKSGLRLRGKIVHGS
jgi:hypothetical protein